MKNPGRKKKEKNIPEKRLLELANYSMKTNEHQFRSPLFLHKTILTISNVGVGKPATRGAISWSMVLGRWTICGEIAAFTKLNPWQRRHVNMPVLMSSCIILHGDLLKPWSYYLVEEQWTFSTVFDKIMRGELSSSESEAYAMDIIGFPNQSRAFTNSKQNIWIFLIAGNVGSGWQLCMLKNFHWTFSLKWLYLKSELTMLHTCFLMTIYSTCTRCILTEFSFIYGVV